MMADEYIAAILIRGLVKVNTDIKDTLFMLRLRKKHTCVILKATPSILGMLQKAKDYITYGPVSKETVDALKARKSLVEGQLVFAMAPPKGGFERGGIKKTFMQGGVLGKRDSMNELIKKMM